MTLPRDKVQADEHDFEDSFERDCTHCGGEGTCEDGSDPEGGERS